MTDITEYTTRLTSMFAEITHELSTLGVHAPETDDWITLPANPQVSEPDPNDEADTTEDWNERRAILSQLETRYNNIKRALQKIQEGTFGACEVCGGVIETDRLNANPAARTCKTHLEDEASLPLR